MKKFGVLCLLLLLPVFAHAQTETSVDPGDATQIGNSVSFILTPAIPGPRTPIHAVVESFGIDLDSASIVWTLNGTEIKRGLGATSVDITSGNIGSRSTLSVTITTTDGTAITRSYTITPGEIDLLVQGETYAPPFYKGRTLWTHQGQLTLVAIPHVTAGNSELDPKSVSYRWTKDGTVLGSLSGTGKNSLALSDSTLSRPIQITVDVMTDEDTIVGTRTLALDSTDPKVLVYENNPLYGLLFNREVGGSLALVDKEVTFSAIPYFFSGSAKRVPALSYSWSTNGASAQTGDKITYRTPDNTSGSSNVSVTVTNTNTFLQSAAKSFLVQFGKDRTSL